jgi:hypothetical protein
MVLRLSRNFSEYIIDFFRRKSLSSNAGSNSFDVISNCFIFSIILRLMHSKD